MTNGATKIGQKPQGHFPFKHVWKLHPNRSLTFDCGEKYIMNQSLSKDGIAKLAVDNSFIVEIIVVIEKMVDLDFPSAWFGGLDQIESIRNKGNAVKHALSCRLKEIVQLYSVNGAN